MHIEGITNPVSVSNKAPFTVDTYGGAVNSRKVWIYLLLALYQETVLK